MHVRHRSINSLIASNSVQQVDELSTDAQTLFGLLTLITNIKYRVKYGESLDAPKNEQYSESTIKNVVADQISPVDDGLLRH